MKRLFLLVALFLAAIGTKAQTQTTTITIVAPASLGTVTPTPSHFYQNTPAAISFASSTNGFNSTCTVTVGTAALTVNYSATTQLLTGNLTAAMTSGTIGSSVTITISCTASPLTMNTPVTLPNGKVGVSYSASLLTLTNLHGGVPPYNWSASGLPPGLTLSSSGVVSGTPSGAGSTNFTFTVTDSSGLARVVKAKIHS
jgi:hypothetical protein